MSGPWDRPSSQDPDDRESAAQDRESPPDNAQSAEPWAPTDPWGESRSSEPGWDVWPPPSPPPDDYYSEPDSSHDLWSEPWEEEAAAMGAGSPDTAYEPARIEPAPYEAAALEQPAAPAFDEPEPYEPEPHAPEPYEPEPHEPEPAAPEPAMPEPGFREPVEPEPAYREPAEIEPSVPEPPRPDVAPLPRPEPYLGVPYVPEPHEPSFGEPAPVDETADGATGTWEPDDPDRRPWAAAAVTGATVLPDWLAEPLPEWPSRDLRVAVPAAEVPAAEVPAAEVPAADAPAAEEVAEPPGWLDAGLSEPAPAAPDETWAAPEPIEEEPPLEPDATEAEGDDARAGWAVAGLAAAGVAAGEPEAPAQEPPTAAPEPERAPDSEPPTEEIELETGPEPEPESSWPPPFLETDESTRVYPTDWTAPPVTPSEPEAGLEPGEAETRTVAGAEPEIDAEAEPGSTAEQAVPWLIGLVLLLAGMVIVLLALIFAGDGSLGGESPQPSASLAAAVPTASATPRPSVPASARASASVAPAPTPTPVPAPVYGPLEMVYQGRAAALAPIYLLLHDFTTEDEAMVLAQDPTIDVRRFAWAPDGTVGAGLLADVLVSIEIGESKRNLGEDLATLTFGPDASTVYAVRVTPDGGDDTATILAVDFASGESAELGSVSYARPEIGSEPALQEAQFTDEGGTIRLFWMHDGSLRLWVLGAGTWTIDPESGEATDLESERLPILRDPEGAHTVVLEVADDASSTTLHYRNINGNELEAASAPGLVSHLRWSPNGDRIVFTVGRSASGGGVVQDLFLWDLDSEASPMQITNTGAAFGAEWRGTMPRWDDA